MFSFCGTIACVLIAFIFGLLLGALGVTYDYEHDLYWTKNKDDKRLNGRRK